MKKIVLFVLSIVFVLQGYTMNSIATINTRCYNSEIDKQEYSRNHSCCSLKKSIEEKSKSHSKKCCKGFDFCTCSFQLNIPKDIILELSFTEIEVVENNFFYQESSSTFYDYFFQPPRFA